MRHVHVYIPASCTVEGRVEQEPEVMRLGLCSVSFASESGPMIRSRIQAVQGTNPQA